MNPHQHRISLFTILERDRERGEKATWCLFEDLNFVEHQVTTVVQRKKQEQFFCRTFVGVLCCGPIAILWLLHCCGGIDATRWTNLEGNVVVCFSCKCKFLNLSCSWSLSIIVFVRYSLEHNPSKMSVSIFKCKFLNLTCSQ